MPESMSKRSEVKLERNYYLYKLFYKLPFPYLIWPSIIATIYIIFYLIEYRCFFGSNCDSKVHAYYFGNLAFSIISLFLIITIYRINLLTIEDWIGEKQEIFLEDSASLVNRINNDLTRCFGTYHFVLIVILIIVRRALAYILDIIYKDINLNLSSLLGITLGEKIIDTITLFFVYSLFLVSLGVIYSLYVTGSCGVKAKYPFELKYIYSPLTLLVLKNSILIGFLSIYGLLIISWVFINNQISLIKYIAIFVYILGFLSTSIIFVIGISGIRQGIIKSKRAMRDIISKRMDDTLKIYENILNIDDKEELDKLIKVISLNESLAKKFDEIENVSEWMWDFRSIAAVVLTSMASIIVSAFNYIISHIPK